MGINYIKITKTVILNKNEHQKRVTVYTQGWI